MGAGAFRMRAHLGYWETNREGGFVIFQSLVAVLCVFPRCIVV